MIREAPAIPPPVRSFPLRDYPKISRFALDLVDDKGSVSTFLNRKDLPSLQPTGVGRQVPALVTALKASNAAWGNEIGKALDLWSDGQTITIVAGQQVGIAGGPIYTLAKIASMLKLRRDFASRNILTTLFFWMATEDHDYEEISSLRLLDGVTVSSADRPARRYPVGGLTIPEGILRELRVLCGESAGWLADGVTFGDSFAGLLSEVLRGQDVILVDSLEPQLRRLGAPLFEKIVHEFASVEQDLQHSSEALSRAGHNPQIMARDGERFPLLFLIDERGERQALTKSGDAWMAGRKPLLTAELLDIIRKTPERLSTGAAARPLLQDFVLQPDIFVGGPAEVAYYAQLTPLHARFQIPQPHIALRGHALVVPEKIIGSADRHGILLSEIFDSADQIASRREKDALGVFHRANRDFVQELERAFDPLRNLITASDASLDRSLSKSLGKMKRELQRVQLRGERAIARRDRERYSAITRLTDVLAPSGTPQDRVTGWLEYWLIYRQQLLNSLIDAIEPDSSTVKVVIL